MNEPLIIIRPGSVERSTGALPLTTSVFVKDSRAILALTDDEIEKITSELASRAGFCDYAELIDLVRRVTGGRSEARHAASFIWNVDRIWRNSDEPLPEFLDTAQTTLREAAVDEEGLTLEERDRLAQRLPRIVTGARSLYLQWRADRVTNATGLPLEEARLFCDARPVFNEDRSEIEGMVFLTTLKIQATGLDGLPTGLEVRLSPKQLRALVKTVTDGEAKLKTMGALMGAKGIPFTPVDTVEAEGDLS